MKTVYALTDRFYLILNNIRKLAAAEKYEYTYKPHFISDSDMHAIINELINRNFYVKYTNKQLYISWNKSTLS